MFFYKDILVLQILILFTFKLAYLLGFYSTLNTLKEICFKLLRVDKLLAKSDY